jgi:uncharacterized C2H2 Zn-finger protein
MLSCSSPSRLPTLPAFVMPDGSYNDSPHHAGATAAPEVLLVCPQCAAPLTASAYEAHLHQAHRLVFFRGRFLPHDDALAFLLNLVAAPTPDAEAWRALAVLARADHGQRADAFLASTLGGLLARVGGKSRGAAVEAMATLLTEEGDASLTAALSGEGEIAARWLALALMPRLPMPFDPALLKPLRGLLVERGLPVEAKFAALAALMRSAGPESKVAVKFLRNLIRGLGKGRALDRLRRFEQRFGATPAIDALCAKLEARIRMACPRCPTTLRRPAMMRHLWDAHQLILDGRRVREPWAVVEDWIAEYRKDGDPALLELCRIRGPQLDPTDGLHRVHRLLLRSGATDAEARDDLLMQARERHASLCPHCFALAPQPREAPPMELDLRPQRLSTDGYAVEITSKGIWNTLEVRAPGCVLFHGREGSRFWTHRGATLFLAGPWVLLALATALTWDGLASVVAVVVLAAAAQLTQWIVRKAWSAGAPPERLLCHAWMRLAPGLHESGFHPEDSAFLAGLALITPPGAFPRRQAPFLANLLKRTEEAVAAGSCPPSHLAALHRLAMEEAGVRGADLVPLVVDQLACCFEGQLPLIYAESLLTDWRNDGWTRGARIRLRVLLCDRAFEAGFEVTNLLDVGRTGPVLGEILGTEDAADLAALRLLWSQRPTRPWDHCGEARTVFDLAADASSTDLLGRRPDLLLWQREPSWVVATEGGEEPMRAAEIMLCTGGVWLQEVRFTEAPTVVEETHTSFGGQLALGKRRFRGAGEIDALARRMERWFRFAFNDFLPQMANVAAWRSPERAAILRAWGAAPCPECGRPMLPRVGAIGAALDEAAP